MKSLDVSISFGYSAILPDYKNVYTLPSCYPNIYSAIFTLKYGPYNYYILLSLYYKID